MSRNPKPTTSVMPNAISRWRISLLYDVQIVLKFDDRACRKEQEGRHTDDNPDHPRAEIVRASNHGFKGSGSLTAGKTAELRDDRALSRLTPKPAPPAAPWLQSARRRPSRSS